jgi:hypothetical protein
VAAYGAFIIPQVFGEQIKAATAQVALYGFANSRNSLSLRSGRTPSKGAVESV